MKTKSAIFEAVHETASELFQHGFINQKRMREYDLLCLKELPDYSAEQIREIRNKYRMSQPVFASLLNASLSTVKQWEIGDKRPSGVSTRLLSILDKKVLMYLYKVKKSHRNPNLHNQLILLYSL